VVEHIGALAGLFPACDNPTPMGYNCRFDIQVASSNIGASMYNNVPMGFFYVDKETGKWAMRPPF
jgi:hypothetical protein